MEKGLATFRDLNAWQAARELFLGVYSATKSFPREEICGIVSQMNRSSMSVASNIAEGFGRETIADKAHFYVMARGSLTELQNQLILCQDVGLLSNERANHLEQQATKCHKLIVGLVKSIKRRTA